MATMSGGGGSISNIRNTGSTLASNAAVADRRATSPAATATPIATPVADTTTVDSTNYYVAPVAPPPPPMPTASDALSTPDYMAAEAALRNAQELFRSEQEANKSRYNIDFGKAIENLGWIQDPSGAGGKWDEGDLLTSQGKETASGRAFSNQLNDFASRGLLQSGLFATQRNALQNELAQKLASTEQSRSRFLEDLTGKERNFMADQERARQDALNAAKQNLMSQYLAQYGGA